MIRKMRLKFFASRDDRAAKLSIKCLVIVVLFLLGLGGLVYPVYSRVQGLENTIAGISSKIAEQDVYLPFYAKLQSIQSNVPVLDLPLSKKVPLERHKAFGIVEEVERIAHQSDMETLDISVDQDALRAGQGTTVLTGVFSGKAGAFHDFYVAVNALPYVKETSKLELRAVPGGVEVFLKLAVLIHK